MTDLRDIEQRSSAITLSDMEMFIFPDLIYSLVLANIMSPRIWRWREDPWFDGVERLNPYRRILRLKQYIMDNYQFNLDLETWGLTTQERELKRFRNFIDEETLANANALFGYEGDKYYFDIDIRTHFGLDKYRDNVIPYWKTETVEAMDAFKHKLNYATGAGECVSLAALYSAALFIIAGIPLNDIYMMATPLHSQNFIDIDDGLLTNNRRLLTKNMWFNGTALSAQARRAQENERITMVVHETGYVHTVYKEASIDVETYTHFTERLRNYMKVRFDDALLGNFLRYRSDLQKCFQFKQSLKGINHYIAADKVYAYEQSSSYRVNDNTREKLLLEIERDEFQLSPMPRRIVMNELEHFIRQKNIDMDKSDDVARLKEQFASDCLDSQIAIENLAQFCHVEPRLPDIKAKEIVSSEEPLGIQLGMTRPDIIGRLEAIRERSNMAEMAFYAYRDINRTEPEPFLIAATERNPVSIEGSRELDVGEILSKIGAMPDESIYDEPGRLAQPDEVWNYGRGDGVEKALLLANILRSRMREVEMTLEVSPHKALLKAGKDVYNFKSIKEIRPQVWSVDEPLNEKGRTGAK